MADSTMLDGGPGRWRRTRRVAAALMLSLLVVGPWPVDDSGFDGSGYQRRTLDRLDALAGPGPSGPIRVGVAEVDLTPDRPRPLAGFIGQVRTPYVGVDSPCLARALTVDGPGGPVTILTADLLLINAKLAAEVVRRSGVRADQVYFTASHTHGGPGGWGEHPLEMLVAGAYDPAFFDDLAGRLAGAVRASRAATVPAELAFVQASPEGRQVNRVEPGRPTHDPLSALVFRAAGAVEGAPPLAILAVFGAHATVSHPVPPRLGGDYPAALVEELKRRTGAGAVLFASGAVGDASPARPKARSQLESARMLGKTLADDLLAALPSARYEREVVVASLRLDVDLPPLRLPFLASGLRFSPAATWWIARGMAPLQALRLGPATLVGFPGDYSGHLADRLVASSGTNGPKVVATSFDGDFRGYLVSGDTYYRRSCYETRWMSFYGPWSGDYLTDLGRRLAGRLAADPRVEARPTVDRSGPMARAALGLLLLGALIRVRRELARWAGPLDLVSQGMLCVALASILLHVASPGLVAGAGVGLPTWARWLGVPLGVIGLARGRRAPAWEATLTLGAAAFCLSASWPLALGLGRALLMGGGRGVAIPALGRPTDGEAGAGRPGCRPTLTVAVE